MGIIRLLCILVLFVSSWSYANVPFDIVQTYYQIEHTDNSKGRLEQVSRFFLDRPYQLGVLGEGANGKYDKRPLYNLKSFDCVTFVDTSLALAMSQEPRDFLVYLRQLRYRDSKIGYIYRNHFTSLDWNLNNNHYVKDITTSIKDAKGRPIVAHSTALIDKRAWFQHKKAADLALPGASELRKREVLSELKADATEIQPTLLTIAYLPLERLFDENGKPINELFSQIPSGSIIEIVRPNWQLRDKIGTNLHISHVGFAFRGKDGELNFRQASSTEMKVTENRLHDYLKQYLKSPTVKGIKVLVPTKL